ncbi:hypothetical protein COMNV_01015 [Commensalibacter sp. Nvir]|uniref:hypothetical protein n=1 Tax=Commensalibacter sp. Nvir TaxID=3069817 RepID=UPI002D31B6F1|nr:hypothetical protein COMNV_01015 [Commensalibacter sp. Nvir]
MTFKPEIFIQRLRFSLENIEEKAKAFQLGLNIDAVNTVLNHFEQNPNDLEINEKLIQHCILFEQFSLANTLIERARDLFPHEFRFVCLDIILISLVNDQNEFFDLISKQLKKFSPVKDIDIDFLNQKNNFFSIINFLLDMLEGSTSLPPAPIDYYLLIFPYDVNTVDIQTKKKYCDHFIKFCNYCGQRDINKLTNFLALENKVNPNKPWYCHIKGKLHWFKHERHQTDYYFRCAKQKIKEELIEFCSNEAGVYTWLSVEETIQFDFKNNCPDLFGLSSWHWHHNTPKNYVPSVSIILGCDTHYFRFFPKFLLSLVKAFEVDNCQTSTVITLAVDNISSQQIQFLQETATYLLQKFPNFYLEFTYGNARYEDGAVFASLRYLIAKDIFQKYTVPTFIFDIDGMIPEDFYQKFHKLKHNNDFSFRLFAFDSKGNQYFTEPWSIGATCTYYGQLEITSKILVFMKYYLNHAYSPNNTTNWCIDQCALAQAYERYIRPNWKQLRITDADKEQILIFAQHVGSKEEFYRHGGVVDMNNFRERLNDEEPPIVTKG